MAQLDTGLIGQNHVLVVDDEPLILESLTEFLISRGFLCETASNGRKALEIFESQPFEIVLTDMRMPDLDGLQLLEYIHKKDPDVAIIMLTVVNEVETAVQAMKLGAWDYVTKPFNLDKVSASLDQAHQLRQARDENKKNIQKLEAVAHKKSAALSAVLQDLKEHDNIILEVLGKALHCRGHETLSHSKRVQGYAVRLSHQFGFRSRALTDLSRGALLHDIGEIAISDAIFLKPGTLDPEEQVTVRRHPVVGSQILQGVRFLHQAAKIVLYHHERYDGLGYPMGLKGDEIPLEAMLFSVVDAYDAMTSDRPYRKALSPELARKEIASKAGTQFDPSVVGEFLKVPQWDWDKISAKFA